MNKQVKNIMIVIITIISILIGFCSFSIATVTGTVTGNTVNVRKSPTTTSDIVGVVSKNDSLQVVEKSGDWYKVIVGGKEGYIRGDLISVSGFDDTTINPTPEPSTDGNTTPESSSAVPDNQSSAATEGNTGTETSKTESTESTSSGISTIKLGDNQLSEGMTIVISDSIDLKIIPVVNSSNIYRIEANTQVVVLEILNNWCKIEAGDSAGWLRIEK